MISSPDLHIDRPSATAAMNAAHEISAAMSYHGVLFAVILVVASTVAQDQTACASYDVSTGKGICNGVSVNIGAVICADGFIKELCKAALPPDSNGRVETYYFKVKTRDHCQTDGSQSSTVHGTQDAA